MEIKNNEKYKNFVGKKIRIGSAIERPGAKETAQQKRSEDRDHPPPPYSTEVVAAASVGGGSCPPPQKNGSVLLFSGVGVVDSRVFVTGGK